MGATTGAMAPRSARPIAAATQYVAMVAAIAALAVATPGREFRRPAGRYADAAGGDVFSHRSVRRSRFHPARPEHRQGGAADGALVAGIVAACAGRCGSVGRAVACPGLAPGGGIVRRCADRTRCPALCRGLPQRRLPASAPLSDRSDRGGRPDPGRSEEHTSELQSLMRISYAVFGLKKKTSNTLQ